MKLLEFIFIDFWHWAGSMTILYILTHFMYFRAVRKVGFPPSVQNGESSPIKSEEAEKVNE